MSSISVIIPTYNRCHLIGLTIDSILNQTIKAHEIIVVDDHSNDGTLNWLRNTYGDKLILLTTKGKGPGAARNTGLEFATGEYIKFFDSDDVMSANTLEVQLKKIIDTGKPYVTSPYCYATEKETIWTPIDNTIINYYGFPQHKPLTHWMIWGLFICIPTMLFKRSFLHKIGPWPENFITSEDWAYLWRIAMLEPYPAHTNECLFYYRVHPNQSTGENLNNRTRDYEKFEVLSQIYRLSIEKGSFSWFEKALFRNKFFQMSRIPSNEEFKNELIKIAGKGQNFLWQYYRIKMKLGRIKTKSIWQPMHGVKINNYL